MVLSWQQTAFVLTAKILSLGIPLLSVISMVNGYIKLDHFLVYCPYKQDILLIYYIFQLNSYNFHSISVSSSSLFFVRMKSGLVFLSSFLVSFASNLLKKSIRELALPVFIPVGSGI